MPGEDVITPTGTTNNDESLSSLFFEIMMNQPCDKEEVKGLIKDTNGAIVDILRGKNCQPVVLMGEDTCDDQNTPNPTVIPDPKGVVIGMKVDGGISVQQGGAIVKAYKNACGKYNQRGETDASGIPIKPTGGDEVSIQIDVREGNTTIYMNMGNGTVYSMDKTTFLKLGTGEGVQLKVDSETKEGELNVIKVFSTNNQESGGEQVEQFEQVEREVIQGRKIEQGGCNTAENGSTQPLGGEIVGLLITAALLWRGRNAVKEAMEWGRKN